VNSTPAWSRMLVEIFEREKARFPIVVTHRGQGRAAQIPARVFSEQDVGESGQEFARVTLVLGSVDFEAEICGIEMRKYRH